MPEWVQNRFSPDERRAVAARLEGGESAEALAAELGVHKSQVYRWLRAERGLPNGARKGPARAKAEAQAAEALAALAAVMKGAGSEASRLAAAKAILDRTLGRPGQQAPAKPRGKPPLKRIERVIVHPRDVPGHPAYASRQGDR